MPPPNFHEQIQVDTSDEDSLCDTDSVADSTLSFASTVRDYYYENGRRYHAYRYGQYPIPNDEEEQARLNLCHHLFKVITGDDLFRAPLGSPAQTQSETQTETQAQQPTQQQIQTQSQQPQQQQPPKRILDIGTGTGAWALEAAELYPDAEIVGTDLSPIQPSFSPPNCTFITDDAESDWAFTEDEAFDFIHARSMGGGIADWDRLLKQAYGHLRPGGWLELQEFEARIRSDDGTHEKAPMLLDFQKRLDEASRMFGKRVNIAGELAGWMEGAGFVNVTEDIYKCPIGSWPKNRWHKNIGRVNKDSVIAAIEPYSLALFTRVLGWSYEEALDYVDKCRKEVQNSSCHIYMLFYYVYAQRPLDDSR